jgi:hypothetical protein
VRRLDATINATTTASPSTVPNPVEEQMGLLKAAFGADAG